MSTAGEFPEALEDWWADYVRSLGRRGHGRSEETVKLYRRSYERFWHWAMTQDETRAPADVTTKTVNAWVDELRTQVAPTTVAVYWRNLRPFFSWWAKEVEVTNPFAGADVPSAKPQDPDVIDLDDIRAPSRPARAASSPTGATTPSSGCCSTLARDVASSSPSPSTTGTDDATT